MGMELPQSGAKTIGEDMFMTGKYVTKASLRCSATALAFLSLIGSANAQENADEGAEAEIIVTATLRSENLQDVPI
ncbi:MAG: hypothetical protein ACK5B7_09365, partial [Novosphingobium sp.]